MFGTNLKKLVSEIDENTKVISDMHFNHKNILKFEKGRLIGMKEDGFLEDHMDIFEYSDVTQYPNYRQVLELHNEWIITNWNKVVQPDELVLCLGDIAWKGIPDTLPLLNGRIILILGNHDRGGSYSYNYDNVVHVVRGLYTLELDHLCISESTDELFSALRLTMKIGNSLENVILSHYPITTTEDKYTSRSKHSGSFIQKRIDTLIKKADDFYCTVDIHGHTHSRIILDPKADWFFLNASMENTGFRPVPIKELALK